MLSENVDLSGFVYFETKRVRRLIGFKRTSSIRWRFTGFDDLGRAPQRSSAEPVQDASTCFYDLL